MSAVEVEFAPVDAAIPDGPVEVMVDAPATEEKKRKVPTKKKFDSYKTFLRNMIAAEDPETSATGKTMTVLNTIVRDIVDKVNMGALQNAKDDNRTIVTPQDARAAFKLLLDNRGASELTPFVIQHANKVLETYRANSNKPAKQQRPRKKVATKNQPQQQEEEPQQENKATQNAQQIDAMEEEAQEEEAQEEEEQEEAEEKGEEQEEDINEEEAHEEEEQEEAEEQEEDEEEADEQDDEEETRK